jgi:Fe-S-cluster containining protein
MALSPPTDKWGSSSESQVENELATLCRSCGLCCDGSLFGRVPLTAEELPAARKNRLRVVPSGAAFEQPCASLARGERSFDCATYGERPGACRRFTCHLYERHRRSGGALAPRLESVRRARELLHTVTRRGAAAVGSPEGEELARRLEEDFGRA